MGCRHVANVVEIEGQKRAQAGILQFGLEAGQPLYS
jgi:hypothetical protein